MSNCTADAFCRGMALALRGVPMNFAGKGLSTSFGWLGESSEGPSGPPRLVGVTYAPRAGDAIVLNFCPWCGAKIRFDEETDKKTCSAIESGGAQCELLEGHAGPHACPEAVARFDSQKKKMP